VLGLHSGSPPSGARLTVRRPPRAARNALMSSNRAFSMSRALPVRTGFGCVGAFEGANDVLEPAPALILMRAP
jgi:hypothetical protein